MVGPDGVLGPNTMAGIATMDEGAISSLASMVSPAAPKKIKTREAKMLAAEAAGAAGAVPPAEGSSWPSCIRHSTLSYGGPHRWVGQQHFHDRWVFTFVGPTASDMLPPSPLGRSHVAQRAPYLSVHVVTKGLTELPPLSLEGKIIDYANRAKKDSNTARWLTVALAGNAVADKVVQIGTKHAQICEGAYKKLAQMNKDGIKDEGKYAPLFNLLDKQFVLWAEHENIGKDMEKRMTMKDCWAGLIAARSATLEARAVQPRHIFRSKVFPSGQCFDVQKAPSTCADLKEDGTSRPSILKGPWRAPEPLGGIRSKTNDRCI
jgi:hypothetical protein